MPKPELHVLHIDAHLGDFLVADRYLRNPEELEPDDFEVSPLIRNVQSCQLSIRTFPTLRRLLRQNQLDAVILFIPAYPNLFQPFPHRNPLKNLPGIPAFLGFLIRYWLLYFLLKEAKAPLLIFDRLDATVIDKRWHRFIGLCQGYFKRELPKCPANAFLYSERIAAEPWVNSDRYSSYIAKLRPFSDGVHDNIVAVPIKGLQKDIDILWGGNVTISPVRENGLKLLRKLKEMGYNVMICEKKVPRDEFYEMVQRSYLVWSPEGTGWQCFKHYETCAMASVPVISYPTIWQDMPLQDGVNCFYYDPEQEGLIEVVKRALLDKHRLVEMGREARPFVLRNHTQLSGYLRAVFASVG